MKNNIHPRTIKTLKKLPENLKGELTVVISEISGEKNEKEEIDESIKIKIKKMMKKYSLKDVVEFISQ